MTTLALLSESSPPILTKYQPAGDIRDIQLSWNNNELQSAKLIVDEFASLPVDEWPGVSGLSLQLDWNPLSTQLMINSRDLTLYAPTWLPEAIYFDVVEASVDWTGAEQNWQMQLTELNIWNNDLTFRGKIGLVSQSDATLADIDLQMLDVAVASWLSYVPRSILVPDYLEWAEDAYTSGQIESGNFTLKGNLAEFPFTADDSANVFEFTLNVVDVGLDYGEGWPALESIAGQVVSSANKLDILPKSGRIAGFDFVDVSAVINNIYAGKPVLDLTGLLSGTTQNALNFLQNSPLSPRYGDITDWVSAQGNSNIVLNLKIPLLDPNATDVTGHLSFESSQLSLAAMPEMPN